MFSAVLQGWIARRQVSAGSHRDRGGEAVRMGRRARRALAWSLWTSGLLAFASTASPAAPPSTTAADTGSAKARDGDAPREDRFPASKYFSVTPQLTPLRPFAHLPPHAQPRIRAAVVTAPDPRETRLGRSFDMEVAAMISGFQARGYVLDGFALAWQPRDTLPAAQGKGTKPGEPSSERIYREAPSVALFRRDQWRSGEGVEYYVAFLVGDSQTFGVEPLAFEKAARCAMLLNRISPEDLERVRGQDCDEARSTGRHSLDVIGPSFSGSVQSLAIALGNLCGGPCSGDIDVALLSPAASVGTNQRIESHPFLSPVPPAPSSVVYRQLPKSLKDQIAALLSHLCRVEDVDVRNVTILAEESTFGQEAVELEQSKALKSACAGKLRISSRQFPPNIASIRAERSLQRNAQREKAAEQALPLSSRLLELDISGAEVALDRPTVYQPTLSSRSDELMLYRNFDAMRVRRSPDVVIIVATDIRDRLFLLSEVRKSLPRALPVVVDLDFLMVHPDYRKVSRGAVVLAAGEPVVYLEGDRLGCHSTQQRRDIGLLPQRREEHRPRTSAPASRKLRQAFATDYAANMFRAVVLMDGYGPASGPFGAYVDHAVATHSPEEETDEEPVAYVATMAGYQELGSSEQSRGSLLAVADVRLAMQEPTYLFLLMGGLFFVIMAAWVWCRRDRAKVVLPSLRGLVNDFRALTAALWRRLRHRRRSASTPSGTVSAAVVSLEPAWRRTCLTLITTLGATAFAIATYRWVYLLLSNSDEYLKDSRYFMLAHGRDIYALACIWLLYAALCIVAYMRLNISNRRYAIYNAAFARNARRRTNGTRVLTGISWGIPVACGLLLMVLIRAIQGEAVSIDSNSVWLVAAVVMATGLSFVVNMFWQMRLLGNLSLSLARLVGPVRNAQNVPNWPDPQSIREPMQTPFNLALREYKRDMPALLRSSPRVWAKETLGVMGNGGSTMNPWQFERWTERLVAELKLCVVTIRTCAWCAMLAPISVLVAMSVYPPVHERLMTSIAIMLLVASFAATILIVLRLEKDAMLGPMFTSNGNVLTFGGAVGALWPKFVAMALVLLPLAAPEALSWAYGLVRSINSFG